MKLTQLENEISTVFFDDNYRVEKEYVTGDNSRVDLAILKNGSPELAVEFEESYKWMRARVLYDAVKADREGFPHLAIVYAFEMRGLENAWIWDYISNELDVSAEIVHPEDIRSLSQKV